MDQDLVYRSNTTIKQSNRIYYITTISIIVFFNIALFRPFYGKLLIDIFTGFTLETLFASIESVFTIISKFAAQQYDAISIVTLVNLTFIFIYLCFDFILIFFLSVSSEKGIFRKIVAIIYWLFTFLLIVCIIGISYIIYHIGFAVEA